jgi:hypothetical protein
MGTWWQRVLRLSAAGAEPPGHHPGLQPADDFAGTDSGAAYLFSGSTGSLISAFCGSAAGDRGGSSCNFTTNGSGSTITPGNGDRLTRSPSWGGSADALTPSNLSAGSDIATNNRSRSGGDLTPQAGRHVVLNSSITTDNGKLTVIANETVANGAVVIHHDPGRAVIDMADGTTIHAGTGNVAMQLASGTGHAG